MRFEANSRKLALIAALIVTPLALAGMGDTIFDLAAVNASNGEMGHFGVSCDDGFWQYPTEGGAPVFTWQLSEPVNIVGSRGAVIATLTEASIELLQDPEVHINFVVTAGSSPASFVLTSTNLTFPTLLNAQGKSEVVLNVSDLDGDGATASTSTGYSAMAFSHFNNAGVPSTGSLFASLLSSDVTAGSFGSGQGVDDTAGFQAIPGAVSSISNEVRFDLSAFDLASGTSSFVVTPEPASFILLAVVGLLRRR